MTRHFVLGYTDCLRKEVTTIIVISRILLIVIIIISMTPPLLQNRVPVQSHTVVEAEVMPPKVVITPAPAPVVKPKPRAVAKVASRHRTITVHKYQSPKVTGGLTEGGDWYRLRKCESGSDGLYLANTGNGFYGAYQFTKSSWAAVGGTGYPHNAPPSEQDMRAKRLKDLQGWGAWPACSRKLGLR